MPNPFGPRGGYAHCRCQKWKKPAEKRGSFTCACGHNMQHHEEAQPTVEQQIAWMRHIGVFEVRYFGVYFYSVIFH